MRFNNPCKKFSFMALPGVIVALFSAVYTAEPDCWQTIEDGSHHLGVFTVDNGIVYGANNDSLWKKTGTSNWEFLLPINIGIYYEGDTTDKSSYIPGHIFNIFPGNPYPLLHNNQHTGHSVWSYQVYRYNGSKWVAVQANGGKYDWCGFYTLADSSLYYINGTGDDNPEKTIAVAKYNIFTDTSIHTSQYLDGLNSRHKSDALSLRVNRNTPYIAYNQSDSLMIKKYTGNSWESLGTSGFLKNISQCDIAFADDNTPYIVAYKGETDRDFITMMRFNGAAWERVGTNDFIGKNIRGNIKLEFFRGSPVIAFIDSNETPSVIMFADGKWNEICAGGISNGKLVDQSITLKEDDTRLYLGYFEKGSTNLIIKSYQPAAAVSAYNHPNKAMTRNFKAVLTNKELHISGGSAAQEHVRMFNVQGQEIKLKKVTDSKYLIQENLSSGLYIIRPVSRPDMKTSGYCLLVQR